MRSMANAPDDASEYAPDLDRALKLLSEKAEDYRLGQEYYEGTRTEVSASPTIRKLIERNAEAAPVSLAHIPVDVISEKIDLAGITAKDAAAAKLLEVVADANDLDDEADDWIHKACYFGDYYVITDPQLEDADGVIDPASIRWVGSSPLSSIIVYDKKDGRTPLYGVKCWEGAKQRWHALMYYDDCTVRLSTPEGTSVDNASKAETYTPDLDDDNTEGSERIEHPGGRMLISHLPIDGKPYGKPVHAKAYGPQDAITKISATNLNNVDGQGFASRWALADPLAEIDDDIDDDFGDDGPDTAPAESDGMDKATTGTSRVRSIPGAIALLRGIKQVGQFDATSSEDFLLNLDWYIRVMAVACGIPMFEFDLKGVQPSGESRRRAEGRAIKHAGKIKRAAGAFIRDIGDTTLALLGTSSEVTANFKPLETATDTEGLELVGTKIKNGVPVRQALLEAGYTAEQVDEWYPADTPHITPALLVILASALTQLGSAKTLQVISDDELRDMLPTILTGARGEGPSIDDEPEADVMADVVTDISTQVKAKAEAIGILVRAGADPEEAAEAVETGDLSRLTFPNVPVTIRIPDADADGLEGAGKPAPKPPAPPADDEADELVDDAAA